MNPTPADVMDMAASLMNDTAQSVYTDAKILPYLNMALDELQEVFQYNNIPVTNEVSLVLTVKSGVDRIGFGTTPSLPGNLVEIQRLWERSTGTDGPWIPVVKRDFVPRSLEDENITQFLVWAWVKQEIRFIPATADNDLKLDYIADIFNTPIKIGDIAVPLNVINVKQYLGFQTAALTAMFVAENETRAQKLESLAFLALERELGIPIKGRQAIVTRRQPFRGNYRRRTNI
jgi:hypothetical protein